MKRALPRLVAISLLAAACAVSAQQRTIPSEARLGWIRYVESMQVEIDGVKLYVLHDLAELDIDPKAQGVKVVISGHSHKPASKMESGVLYVNPGSAGPRRFRLPISIGFLEIDDARVKARLQTLEVD